MKPIIEGKPSPTPAARIVEVDAESTGQRLDNFLIRHLKGVPKTHVYRIIRSGEVRLNKGRTSADARVAEGDLVRLPPVRVSEKIAEKAERPAPAREFPILLEDEQLIAFKDIAPQRPVHILVIPKKHITSLATVSADDAPLLGQMLAKAHEIALAQGSPAGFRVIINTGEIGQQEVQHLHMHILGGPQPVGPMVQKH